MLPTPGPRWSASAASAASAASVASAASTASAASAATFIAAKAINKHLREEMQESMEDGESISDWLGDLF